MHKGTMMTLLSNELRNKLSKNEQLGCGNFLHIATELSPYCHEKHFFTDRPLKTFDGHTYSSMSLVEMKNIVDKYAKWYYGAGVRPKDPVGVYLNEGIENLIHYLALNAIGAIPAIVNGNMPPEIAAKWFHKVGVIGLFSDTPHQQAIQPFINQVPNLQFNVIDETVHKMAPGFLPDRYPFVHDKDDTVQIGHSSGTTGIPKAVIFAHQQFFHGVRYRLGLPFTKGSERMLSALPHSHSAGIAYVMLAVLNGCSVYIMSGNEPKKVLPAIESFKPSMVVAFPETYVNLCDSPLENYDLSSIQLWFNGGDAAHESHIRKLVAHGHHFKNGERQFGSVFIDGLGSSEMGFSLFRNVHTIHTNHYDRCIGKPLEWAEAAILSDEGEPLPPHQIGRLGVKAPSITPGYWNDSLLTMRSRLNGYFLTGDLAYQDDEGRFFHVDRVTDAIQTKEGVVYSLQTEELIMKNCPEICDCTVVASENGRGEKIAVGLMRLYPQSQWESQTALERINAVIHKRGWRPLSAVFLVSPAEFPLGPTGKVLKRQLRVQYRNIPGKASPRITPLHT